MIYRNKRDFDVGKAHGVMNEDSKDRAAKFQGDKRADIGTGRKEHGDLRNKRHRKIFDFTFH